MLWGTEPGAWPSPPGSQGLCLNAGSPWNQVELESKGLGWEGAPQPPFRLGCRGARAA